MMDEKHLNAANANVLVDLGMGLGKLALQCFLEYPNLNTVIGLEFCQTRSNTAFRALNRFAERTPSRLKWVLLEEGSSLKLIESPHRTMTRSVSRSIPSGRRLEFQQGDLFAFPHVAKADIVICETKIRSERYEEFRHKLNQMKIGARLLTYEHLETVYRGVIFPFETFASGERYLTSWATCDGHSFFLYRKVR